MERAWAGSEELGLRLTSASHVLYDPGKVPVNLGFFTCKMGPGLGRLLRSLPVLKFNDKLSLLRFERTSLQGRLGPIH